MRKEEWKDEEEKKEEDGGWRILKYKTMSCQNIC